MKKSLITVLLIVTTFLRSHLCYSQEILHGELKQGAEMSFAHQQLLGNVLNSIFKLVHEKKLTVFFDSTFTHPIPIESLDYINPFIIESDTLDYIGIRSAEKLIFSSTINYLLLVGHSVSYGGEDKKICFIKMNEIAQCKGDFYFKNILVDFYIKELFYKYKIPYVDNQCNFIDTLGNAFIATMKSKKSDYSILKISGQNLNKKDTLLIECYTYPEAGYKYDKFNYLYSIDKRGDIFISNVGFGFSIIAKQDVYTGAFLPERPIILTKREYKKKIGKSTVIFLDELVKQYFYNMVVFK